MKNKTIMSKRSREQMEEGHPKGHIAGHLENLLAATQLYYEDIAMFAQMYPQSVPVKQMIDLDTALRQYHAHLKVLAKDHCCVV